MTLPPDNSDDDVEIVDSGHYVAARNPDADKDEFWALVKNRGAAEAVTVELDLRDEYHSLTTHRQQHLVESPDHERYRFNVPIPEGFDQYVFSIIERDPDE